jgi:HSP20 family molecular chaperone IbpA
MADTAVMKRKHETASAVDTPRTEDTYIPDVDISETGDSIHLVANMPGVDQQSVEVTVENNVLSVEGRAGVEAPQGYTLVGQEYGTGRYRRDFTLSNTVDVDGIKARVRHGVLELTIPKREEVKTRKIEIGG